MNTRVDIAKLLSGGAAVAAGLAGSAQAQDGTGLYAGIGLGDAGQGIDYDVGVPITADYSFTGTAGTVFAGYNFAQGDWVLGVEAGLTGAVDTVFGESQPNDYSIGRTLDVKARAGRMFGNVLVYGSLGYSASELNWRDESFDISGANFGIGAETTLGSNMFVGVDYTARRMDGDNLPQYVDGVDLNTASIRAGFRF